MILLLQRFKPQLSILSYIDSMEFLQPIIDFFNSIASMLDQLLASIEDIVAPFNDLIDRVNNLGASSDGEA